MEWWPLLLMCVVGFPRACAQSVVCPTVIGGSSCQCQTPSGLVDLSPLSNAVGARFSVQNSGTIYKYNPCKGFTDGGCGSGTAVCQGSTTTLGTIGSEAIHYYPSVPNTGFVIYSSGGNSVQINLVCDQSVTTPSFTWGGTISSFYVFDLTSCQCCAGGCSSITPIPTASDAPPSSAVAPGIIGIVLMAVLIATTVVYCVAGGIYMNKRRDAHGLDIIPNRTFWFDVPFLIWDGIKFTFSPCCNRSSGYRSLK